MERTCCIFGAGDYGAMPRPELDGRCFLIAADGGYGQLKQWGMSPHLAVGDFDSLGRVPEDVEVVRHPVRKDDTDMMLAVQEGLARGCGRFLIYGGLGGRLDHTWPTSTSWPFSPGNISPPSCWGRMPPSPPSVMVRCPSPPDTAAPCPCSPGAGRRRTSPSPACSTPWTTARW